LLYGTDLDLSATGNAGAATRDWQETYARDWRFFATNDSVEYKGKQARGLSLPEEVLRKIYHDNAVKWIPGIAPRT
jgi:hypothetical protein